MSSTELAVRGTSQVADGPEHEPDLFLSRINAALVSIRTATVAEAKAVADDAGAIQALLKKRKMALDVLYPVAELKLYAERRIGEERHKVPRTFWIPRTHRVTFDWSEAKKLHDEGVSFSAAARQLGVTQAAVQYAHERGYVRASIQADKPEANRRDFDAELGVSAGAAARWMAIAAIPDDELTEIIKGVKDAEEDLSAVHVLAKYRNTVFRTAVKIEKNLFLLTDGRYQVRTSRFGKTTYFTIPRRDGISTEEELVRARKMVLRLEGRLKRTTAPTRNGLDVSYSHIRKALESLNGCLDELSPEARKLAGEALSRGYAFEDALTKAMNTQ